MGNRTCLLFCLQNDLCSYQQLLCLVVSELDWEGFRPKVRGSIIGRGLTLSLLPWMGFVSHPIWSGDRGHLVIKKQKMIYVDYELLALYNYWICKVDVSDFFCHSATVFISIIIFSRIVLLFSLTKSNFIHGQSPFLTLPSASSGLHVCD